MREEELPGGSDDPVRPYSHAPLPPHERTWRHPSELHSAGMFAVPPPVGRGPGRTLVVGGAVGGLAIAGLVATLMMGGTDDVASLPTASSLSFGGALVRTSIPMARPTIPAVSYLTTTTIDELLVGAIGSADFDSTAPVFTESAPLVTSQATWVALTTTTTGAPLITAPQPSAPLSTDAPAPPVAEEPVRVGLVWDRDFAVTTATDLDPGQVLQLDLGSFGLRSGSVIAIDGALAAVRFDTPVVAPLPVAMAAIHVDTSTASTPTATVALHVDDEGTVWIDGAPDASREGAPVTADSGELIGLCSRTEDGRMKLVPLTSAALVVTRSTGWLGVKLTTVDGTVGVAAVAPGSAAELAGLLAGDTLVTFDGVEVTDADDVAQQIRRSGPGSSVVIGVRHADDALDAAPHDVTVTLSALADAPS